MIKGSNLKAIHVEDLSKIETTKDNTNSKYLLYHVVKKVLDIDPKFAGFPSSLIVSLEAMTEFDLNSLDTKIELMEKGCRDPLGFLIEQERQEAAASKEGGGT